jgi:hypothetical protein
MKTIGFQESTFTIQPLLEAALKCEFAQMSATVPRQGGKAAIPGNDVSSP